MHSYETVLRAIYDAIDEINETAGPHEAVEKSPDAVLLGETGQLDSLGFVTLIASVEENVEQAFNVTINVMDAVTLEDDSFTVDMLANRTAHLVDAATGNEGYRPPDAARTPEQVEGYGD